MLVTTYENTFFPIELYKLGIVYLVASSCINSFKIKVTLISVGLVKK